MNARASAPGKAILFGEHAVVYGQPALAVPVAQVQATAVVAPAASGFWIDAADLRRRYPLDQAEADDALALAVRLTLQRLGQPVPDARLTLTSTIPIASGLGSGAAACTAIVRALAAFLERELPPAEISALVFETEKLLHGTPSGIDNTVVAYAQPVYFVRGQAPAPFAVACPFRLLIADSGLASPTRLVVGDVRAAWQREPERYAQWFEAIGETARQARRLIEQGETAGLGPLMNRNHALLMDLGVSCPELEALAEAARAAGAPGVKLSGAGRGGNLLALVDESCEAVVSDALEQAGARRVIAAQVGG